MVLLLALLLWSGAAAAQGAATPDSLAAVPPSPYRIIRAHAPEAVQVAASLGRYVANFGRRQGIEPGSVFRAYDRVGQVGLVQVERVWRDSAALRLIRLGRKTAAAPLPLDAGYTLTPEHVLLGSVGFAAGQPILDADAQERLRYAARLILAFPQWPVVIEGHTDPSGKKAENQKLSLERAARIRTYLNEVQHIPRDRMHLRAYGSRRPVADNASEAGRQRNRRVDIRLVGELPPELGADTTKKDPP